MLSKGSSHFVFHALSQNMKLVVRSMNMHVSVLLNKLFQWKCMRKVTTYCHSNTLLFSHEECYNRFLCALFLFSISITLSLCVHVFQCRSQKMVELVIACISIGSTLKIVLTRLVSSVITQAVCIYTRHINGCAIHILMAHKTS